ERLGELLLVRHQQKSFFPRILRHLWRSGGQNGGQNGITGVPVMARSARPWFYAEKNAWYIWQGSKKVSLGVQGEGNKAAAVKAWHRLMADGKPTPEPKAQAKVEGPTVAEVITAFLADAESRVKARTLVWYRDFLEPFSVPHGTLRADQLTSVLAE